MTNGEMESFFSGVDDSIYKMVRLCRESGYHVVFAVYLTSIWVAKLQYETLWKTHSKELGQMMHSAFLEVYGKSYKEFFEDIVGQIVNGIKMSKEKETKNHE